MKKIVVLLFAILLTFSLVACGGKELSEVEKIIAEVEEMTLDELFEKANQT